MIPLVVIHYLDVGWTCLSPYEADSPLIVDANAVLSLPVAFQSFQVISGRSLHEIQRLRSIKLGEFSFRHGEERFEPTRTLALVERQSVFALERPDHARSVLRVA